MKRAFVLHHRPFQEHGLLLDIFTQEEGKLSVLAKGVKRPKSKWRSILRPFTLLELDWRGRSSLPTLTQAESLQTFTLESKYLYSAFYINELLQRILPENFPHLALFKDYQTALELLSNQVYIEPVLRRFEWQLAEHLGFSFDWNHEAATGLPIEPACTYYFYPEQGFVKINEPQLGAMVLTGEEIIALGAFDLSNQKRLQVYKHIMRAVLKPYLGNQPLFSRHLFSQINLNK